MEYNEKKRILLIGSFLSKNIGTKGISKLLSELLEDRNWKVITASSHINRALRLSDILWSTWHRRKDYSIAHVDVFSGYAFIWAEMVCQQLHLIRKPYILTLRGGGLLSFAQRWPKRVHHLLSGASVVTTPSLYLQKELSCFRGDIRYIPNGLDIQHYPFNLRSNPKPRLCWLRAFHEIYNPTMAIEVVALLRETIPDIHLTMIGPDKRDGSFDAVLQMVEEKDLGKHIEFTGPVQKADVPIWLQKYDVFINTTHYESFGVAVMEAGAVGLPIVTTGVGELPHLWSNEDEALLVPPGDAHAMAQAVKRILTEPGLPERLSRNARYKAEQFDWSLILPKWESLIKQVLEDV